MDTLINIGLYVTYALLFAAILVLLFFAVKQFAGDIAKSKMTLFGLIGLIVVFGLSFLLSSSSDVSEDMFKKVGTNFGSSKLIGSGLIMSYILFALSLLSMLAVELIKPLKK